MSKNITSISFKDLSGGLNLRDADSRIADNEARALKNFEFTADGSLSKRKGSVKYNASTISSDQPVQSLYRFYKSATSYKKMLAVCNSNLYEGNDDTGVWTSEGSLSANDPCSFVTWGDICYIFNGTVAKTWDGTTLADVSGTPPLGKFVVFRKERLYVAGVSASPNRLYFCDIGDPTTWNTGTNYIDIRSNDGDKITGLMPLGDVLIVYKNNSIWALAGTSSGDFFLTGVAVGVGCMAPQSLVAQKHLQYFLHRTGVYVFDGFAAEKISGKVDPEIHGIPANCLVNAAGVFYKDCYLLSYTPSGQTENNRILPFDTRFGGRWTMYTNIAALCFVVWDGIDDQGELYAGDSGDGFVRRLDTGADDDGNDISTKFESKRYDFGEPTRYKTIKYAHLLSLIDIDLSLQIVADWGAASIPLQFNVKANGGVWDTANWDQGLWGGGTVAVSQASVSQGAKGRLISSVIQETSSKYYELYGWGVDVELEPQSYRELK